MTCRYLGRDNLMNGLSREAMLSRAQTVILVFQLCKSQHVERGCTIYVGAGDRRGQKQSPKAK